MIVIKFNDGTVKGYISQNFILTPDEKRFTFVGGDWIALSRIKEIAIDGKVLYKEKDNTKSIKFKVGDVVDIIKIDGMRKISRGTIISQQDMFKDFTVETYANEKISFDKNGDCLLNNDYKAVLKNV